MESLVYRAIKADALTIEEVDGNFQKIENEINTINARNQTYIFDNSEIVPITFDRTWSVDAIVKKTGNTATYTLYTDAACSEAYNMTTKPNLAAYTILYLKIINWQNLETDGTNHNICTIYFLFNNLPASSDSLAIIFKDTLEAMFTQPGPYKVTAKSTDGGNTTSVSLFIDAAHSVDYVLGTALAANQILYIVVTKTNTAIASSASLTVNLL